MIRVINKRPRLHGIAIGGRPGQDVVLNLWPGVNEVDDAQWAEAMKNKLVQKHIDDEDLEVSEALGPFGELDERAAVKLISETFNRDLLKSWKFMDGRPGVLGAIAAQIEKLTPEHSGTAMQKL